MSAAGLAEPTLVDRLVVELEQLPASRAAALRVVQVVDDPRAGAAAVAGAAGLDPALTARILRVANSVYYGLSGRVATPTFAVTVVGFSTVRSLAAVAAADLADPVSLPPGFWARAASVAAAAALVAPRVGAPVPEAFCAGLLHDLGAALLRQHDVPRYDRVQAAIAARPGPWAMAREEVRAYGATHADLGAQVLSAWRFPPELCAAIAEHHAAPARSHPPLLRALLAGQVLADLAARSDLARRPGPAQQDALAAAGVSAGDAVLLAADVARARDALGSSLGG